MNTSLQAKVAYRFEALPSTNAAAIAHINAGDFPAPGAVYLTEAQTAGRGQGSNQWHATPGANLTLSLVAYPDHLSVDQLFVLNQFVSLAVADTVRYFLPTAQAAGVRVKWPNDVYVDDQKIAGILIQNGLRGAAVSWSVMGIGLNVNETTFTSELTTTATSLALLTGEEIDLESVLKVLLANLEQGYAQTEMTQLPILKGRYRRMQYRLEEPGKFTDVATGQTFMGLILGVTDGGQLRVATSGGERLFALREVRYL